MQMSPYLVSIACLLAGLIALIYLAMSWMRQHAAHGWSATTGKVLESEIYAKHDGWTPRVSYAYNANGKSHTNDRIYLYPCEDTDKQRALGRIAAYPVGKTVTVYYKPDNPADAVLDTAPSLWRLCFFVAFAVLSFAAGIAIYRDPSILG
jgi:hypothetical protein